MRADRQSISISLPSGGLGWVSLKIENEELRVENYDYF